MREPKKRIAVFILIFVYVLLMFSEITVNTVLCYKENGGFDLEMVLLDFTCLCPDSPGNHEHHIKTDGYHTHDHNCDHRYADHHHNGETEHRHQIQSACRHCWDVPFNGSWLDRVNPTRITVEYTVQKVLAPPYLPELIGITGFEMGFIHLKPLSKFLFPPPPLTGTTVLRC